MNNFQEVNRIIKTRGYFEITFTPNVFKSDFLDKKQLLSFIEKSKIQLRGWDYPHIPQSTFEHQHVPYNFDKGIESWTNSGIKKEIWRFYKSGQFIHRYCMMEDWLREDSWFQKDVEPGKFLDVIGVIYRFTEIVQFTKNLFEQIPELGGGELEIKAFNVEGRKLEVLFDPMRTSLWGDYIAKYDPVTVSISFGREEIEKNSIGLTEKLIETLFVEFNWLNPPMEALRQDQIKFLNRQI